MSDTPASHERRANARIDGRFPLRLRSRDAEVAIDCASIATNVSRDGLYTRLLRRIDVGQNVFGVVSLPTGSELVARGQVVRLERLDGGGWGIALEFASVRLQPNDAEGNEASRPGRVLPFDSQSRSLQ